MEELTGGTFTITNGGTFGSLMSTPIVNAPQSAILGMHKIQDRPVVVDGQIVVRPMMYIALTYDHRIIDGREAVQFLVTVKQCLEDPGTHGARRMSDVYDVIVIGAVPAGYPAAIRAGQNKLKVACIDEWQEHRWHVCLRRHLSECRLHSFQSLARILRVVPARQGRVLHPRHQVRRD